MARTCFKVTTARTLEKNGYKTGKKTIQIRFDQEVPATAIEQILKGIAQTNEAQTAACL